MSILIYGALCEVGGGVFGGFGGWCGSAGFLLIWLILVYGAMCVVDGGGFCVFGVFCGLCFGGW